MNDNLTENQTQLAHIQSQRQSRVHQKFLQSRQTALREINHLLRLQTAVVAPSIVQPLQREQVVFARRDLEEFALGSLERCFGPEYAVFNGRQVPRIPNGDLLLFDRVLEIEGQRHQLNAPARIVTACEVPADAWYFQHNASPFVPLSVIMEMALQPCGFLSAYLGTALSAPDQDFLFRNLDGTATLLANLDLHGQTVINHASLHSTISGAGTIIQSFSFCLSCNGVDFYRGESVFGYFPPAVMARQAGLDDQRAPVKLQDQDILPQQTWDVLDESKPSYRLSSGQLNFLDQIQVTKTGGSYGLGMVSAQKTVNPQDWFFSNHFYQDPVMPGSLGVEAIQQTMQAYCLACGLGSDFHSPRFSLQSGSAMQWKYRGQITPAHHEMQIEVQIKDAQSEPGHTAVMADASLWADGKRIYEILNIGMRIQEG
jgi:3-hydroxymyristoyl/3-hydroxydecanoyl-(acyl carrier protein) dehydratase